MSKESIASPLTPLRPVKGMGRFTIACVTAVGTFGFSVAGGGEVAGQEYDLAPEAAQEQAIDTLNALLPTGPCDTAEETNNPLDPAACSRGITSGRTALINFGLPPAAATQIAQGVEQKMASATDGLVKGGVTAVPASSAATIAFSAYDCVDKNDIRTYASVVAEQKMPELAQDYDYVIGISRKNECDEEPGKLAVGIADFERRRNADAMLGAVWNTGSPTAAYDSVQHATDVVIHEEMHLMLLGHSGAVGTVDDTNSWDMNVRDSIADSSKLDANVYASSARYAPYAGLDIMSSVDLSGSEYNHGMNPIHQSYIRSLVHGHDALVQDASRGTRITTKAATQGAFATIPLDPPLEIYADDARSVAAFDGLAIVPEVTISDRDGSSRIQSAEAYVSDSTSRTVASLGTAFETDGKSETWTLTVNGQSYAVQLGGTALKITARP